MQPVRVAARSSIRGLLVGAAFGAFTIGAGLAAGAPTATGIATIVTVTLLFFAVHSSWKLAQGLHAFAEAVPGEADVEVEPDGRARLAWPALNLDVEARAGVLTDPTLEAEAGGQPFEGEVEEAQRVAEEALASLGLPSADPASAQASST